MNSLLLKLSPPTLRLLLDVLDSPERVAALLHQSKELNRREKKRLFSLIKEQYDKAFADSDAGIDANTATA